MTELIETEDYLIEIRNRCDENILEITIKHLNYADYVVKVNNWLTVQSDLKCEIAYSFAVPTDENSTIVSVDFYPEENPDNCFKRVIDFFLTLNSNRI